MEWNANVDVQYSNAGFPWSDDVSFMDYVEGLTYEHVHFIFSGPPHHTQENMNTYPSIQTGLNKYEFSDLWSMDYLLSPHTVRTEEQRTPSWNHPSLPIVEHSNPGERYDDSLARHLRSSVDCPRNLQDPRVILQDDIDPDNLTYEELLELGETVGAQSRGLSPEQIALLPVSKYSGSFFWRKKSRHERCVICQMEYRRGEGRMMLPCQHAYHAECGAQWLSINKACPICYRDVTTDRHTRFRDGQ